MSSLDILQSTLQQKVAEGNLSEEVAAEVMKKMGISGAATVRTVILHIIIWRIVFYSELNHS